MDSESHVSSSVFTLDETLPFNLSLSPACSGSQNIRRILLLHLNLIQDQQEKILTQERELITLQQEKSVLQSKLQRIQRRLSKCTSEYQKDSPRSLLVPFAKSVKLVTNIPVTSPSRELKRTSLKKLKKSPNSSSELELRTIIPYLTYSITSYSSNVASSNLVLHSPLPETQLELPSFMTYTVQQSVLNYSFPFENLSDTTFLKRHKKPEECEKRRKRWDIQRFRELNLQKRNPNDSCLEKKSLSLSLNSKSSTLFTYNPIQLEKIEVADTVPIFAFGRSLPAILPKQFELNIH